MFDFLFHKGSKMKVGSKSAPVRRALNFESLENRELLSVAPLTYDLLSREPDYLQSNWFEQLEERTISATIETDGIIENEWLIQFNQESLKQLYSVSKAADYLDDYGVTVICGLGSPGTLQVRVNADSISLQNKVLAGISGLEYWEPNYAIVSNSVADEVNDTYADRQWYLDTINVLPAWEKTQGESVVVAVIDSGIQLDHPDLQANVWTNLDEIPDNGLDESNLSDKEHPVTN
jgi:subtilisin family serine protease